MLYGSFSILLIHVRAHYSHHLLVRYSIPKAITADYNELVSLVYWTVLKDFWIYSNSNAFGYNIAHWTSHCKTWYLSHFEPDTIRTKKSSNFGRRTHTRLKTWWFNSSACFSDSFSFIRVIRLVISGQSLKFPESTALLLAANYCATISSVCTIEMSFAYNDSYCSRATKWSIYSWVVF